MWKRLNRLIFLSIVIIAFALTKSNYNCENRKNGKIKSGLGDLNIKNGKLAVKNKNSLFAAVKYPANNFISF